MCLPLFTSQGLSPLTSRVQNRFFPEEVASSLKRVYCQLPFHHCKRYNISPFRSLPPLTSNRTIFRSKSQTRSTHFCFPVWQIIWLIYISSTISSKAEGVPHFLISPSWLNFFSRTIPVLHFYSCLASLTSLDFTLLFWWCWGKSWVFWGKKCENFVTLDFNCSGM